MSSRSVTIAIATVASSLALAGAVAAHEPGHEPPVGNGQPAPFEPQPPLPFADGGLGLPKRKKCECKEITAKLKYANAHSYNRNGTETWWFKAFGEIDCDGDGPAGSCKGRVKISGRGVVGGPHTVRCQGKPVCEDNAWSKEFKLRLTRPIGNRKLTITISTQCDEAAKPTESEFELVFRRGALDRRRSDLS